MIIDVGEKAHVSTRRRFDGDVRRHFLGEVTAVDGSCVRLEGYSYIFDPNRDQYVKKPKKRIRVMNLADGEYVVNVLPREADLEAVEYKMDKRQLVIEDGQTFRMDINEFGVYR